MFFPLSDVKRMNHFQVYANHFHSIRNHFIRGMRKRKTKITNSNLTGETLCVSLDKNVGGNGEAVPNLNWRAEYFSPNILINQRRDASFPINFPFQWMHFGRWKPLLKIEPNLNSLPLCRHFILNSFRAKKYSVCVCSSVQHGIESASA